MGKCLYGLKEEEMEASIKKAIREHGLYRVLGDPERTVGLQSYEVKEVLHVLGLYPHNPENSEKEQPSRLK